MVEQDLESAENPFLQMEGLPRFDEMRPEYVGEAVQRLLAWSERELERVEQQLTPTWDGLLRPLEEMDRPWEYVWGSVRHLLGVQNSDDLRKAHEEVLRDVVSFGLKVQQSSTIYSGLKALRDGPGWAELDEAQRRVVDLKLLAAVHAGVGLKGEQRERFNEITQAASEISTEFSNHVLDATKAFALVVVNRKDTEGWPDSLLRLASQSYNQSVGEGGDAGTPKDGPWRITLDHPSFGPFLQHSRNRDQREKLYRAYVTRASEGELDNAPLIERTLKLRKERAHLLGYATYAELSLASKMAPDVDAVQRMFDELLAASEPFAREDWAQLETLAREAGQKEPLAHWDVPFWAERLREKRFDFTDEQLRPYFPLPRVLDGLFSLVERLFGIRIEQLPDETRTWHADVRFFVVRDEQGEDAAYFHLDPYSRPADKRGGAWMAECRARRWIDGKLHLPVVHLCCNGTPPVGDRPSLMSFREVETLFHEFGHGLQAMLTRVDYAEVAGINGVEWDAIELASQFMENWCYHKPTLVGMTAHVDTGEPLPDDLFEKLVAARTYRAAAMMLRQLEFGMTDMALHHTHDPEGKASVFDVHQEIARKSSVLPPLPEDRFLCAFTHIFSSSYAAGYYSYKWAEVLSADAFSAFEEVGLDNEQAVADLGRRFRDTVLAAGGGRHPMEIFRDFRGREPSTEPLLRHSGLAPGA
jgi:oligopeptidase A